MRLVEHPRGPGEVDLPLVFGAVTLVTGLMAALAMRLGMVFPACPLKSATGIPCPTCGGTRMGLALMELDVVGAFLWNPLLFTGIAAVLAAGLVCGLRRLAGRPRVRVVTESARERTLLRLWVLCLLVGGWMYLLARGV